MRALSRGYPGAKAAPGVYQAIINEIPPHRVYVEAFVGGGAILLRKRPAEASIVIGAGDGRAGSCLAAPGDEDQTCSTAAPGEGGQ